MSVSEALVLGIGVGFLLGHLLTLAAERYRR